MDDANTSCSEPARREPDGFLSRGKRLSGHLSWYVLSFVLNQGLPQLVLFPICLHMVGAEGFGKFMFALGIIRIVDVAPTRGLRNTLFRSIAGLRDEQRQPLIRTAFVLALFAVGGLVLLAYFACLGTWAFGVADLDAIVWIAILILPVAARNIIMVGTSDLVVKRRFAQQTLWEGMGGVLAFAALPAFLLIGDVGMPVGYALGFVVPLVLLLVIRRKALFGRPQFDKGMARDIRSMWLVLSVSALFFGSGRYIHRTILGSLGSYETVSVFFAAAAVLSLFLVPTSNLSGFGLMLMSAHSSKKALSPRLLKWYPVVTVVMVAGMYCVISVLAPSVLHVLYSKVGDDALKPMSIMAIGVSMSVMHHASKPIVVKFSSKRALLTIGIVTVMVHLGAAALLIPAWGLTGAAWAYSIGTGAASLTWFAFLLSVIFRPDSNGEPTAAID